MNIILAKSAGFCFGVKRAVETVYKEAEKNQTPIDRDKKVNEITKEERLKFVRLIKAFPLTLNGLRDFNEAIITKGGVRVSEVNPSTMESKLVRHLYFCGEVLDLDALTGGFNLQIAWSTGHLAGMCVE